MLSNLTWLWKKRERGGRGALVLQDALKAARNMSMCLIAYVLYIKLHITNQ